VADCTEAAAESEITDWATRTKLAASSLLRTGNEMEEKGVPENLVAEFRQLALAIPVAVDGVMNTKAASEMLRAHAAKITELADRMEAAVESETLQRRSSPRATSRRATLRPLKSKKR
jgi:hypothetical protein